MITSTPPAAVKHPRQLIPVYALALLLLAMALLQLVNFEAFTQALALQNLSDQAVLLAIVILAFEIFALPFLLRLWLSPLARAVSASFVLLTPALWLAIALQAALLPQPVANLGFFGDFIAIADNVLAVAFSAVLAVLAIWSFRILDGPKAIKPR